MITLVMIATSRRIIIVISVVIYISSVTGVCEKKHSSRNESIGKIILQSAKSVAGEQFLSLDCRAEVHLKGVFFSQTLVSLFVIVIIIIITTPGLRYKIPIFSDPAPGKS